MVPTNSIITPRCSGGGLEFLSVSGSGNNTISGHTDNTISGSGRYPMLCGENGRFSPPVVMFGEEGEPGQVSVSRYHQTE